MVLHQKWISTRLLLFNSLCCFNIFQDLEAYGTSYKGLAKLNRLVYIAEHCPPLKIEALRMALAYVMTTYNTNMYQSVHKKLQEAVSRWVAVYCWSNHQKARFVFIFFFTKKKNEKTHKGQKGESKWLNKSPNFKHSSQPYILLQFLHFTGCRGWSSSQCASFGFPVDRNDCEESSHEVRKARHRSEELQKQFHQGKHKVNAEDKKTKKNEMCTVENQIVSLAMCVPTRTPCRSPLSLRGLIGAECPYWTMVCREVWWTLPAKFQNALKMIVVMKLSCVCNQCASRSPKSNFAVALYSETSASPVVLVSRRGHDDLGDHYLDCGDLSNALKCYSRARDYCTSSKHVVNMCLNVIKVFVQNFLQSKVPVRQEKNQRRVPQVETGKICCVVKSSATRNFSFVHRSAYICRIGLMSSVTWTRQKLHLK